jgi:hypothetical protein
MPNTGRGMTGNRVRTASRRSLATRDAMRPFNPQTNRVLTQEERFRVNRANAASQGIGAFPRTAGEAMGYAGAAATKRSSQKTGPKKKGK